MEGPLHSYNLQVKDQHKKTCVHTFLSTEMLNGLLQFCKQGVDKKDDIVNTTKKTYAKFIENLLNCIE